MSARHVWDAAYRCGFCGVKMSHVKSDHCAESPQGEREPAAGAASISGVSAVAELVKMLRGLEVPGDEIRRKLVEEKGITQDVVAAALSAFGKDLRRREFTGEVGYGSRTVIESHLELISEYANYRLVLTQPNYTVCGQMSDQGDVDVVDINTRGRGGFIDKITIEFLPGVSTPEALRDWFQRKLDALRIAGIQMSSRGILDDSVIMGEVEDRGSVPTLLRNEGLYHRGFVAIRRWDKGAMLVLARFLVNATSEARMTAILDDFGKMELWTDYVGRQNELMRETFSAIRPGAELPSETDEEDKWTDEGEDADEFYSKVAGTLNEAIHGTTVVYVPVGGAPRKATLNFVLEPHPIESLLTGTHCRTLDNVPETVFEFETLSDGTAINIVTLEDSFEGQPDQKFNFKFGVGGKRDHTVRGDAVVLTFDDYQLPCSLSDNAILEIIKGIER